MTSLDSVFWNDGMRLSVLRGWLARTGPARQDRLVAEFLNSARLAAVVTSMATARRSGQHLKLLGACRAYLPASPYVFQAGCATTTLEAADPELIARLQEYYARLAFMSALSDLPGDDWRSDGTLSEPEWRDIENAWCWVCTLAIGVVHHIVFRGADTDTRSRAQLNRIMDLLRAAKDGNQPCVSHDGTVIVPGWLDRRRQERHHLGWPICLEVAGVRVDATLNDISISGMGLANCDPQAVGTDVVVHLKGGRRLDGRVRWADGNRIGATFSTPLPPSDPLLVAQGCG